MKAVGIIFMVLGFVGLGGGAYGMTQEKAAHETIEQNQTLLREAIPGIETELDLELDDIVDLVAIDREMKDNPIYPANLQNAAWDILNAMGDEEEMAMVKLGGLAGGGGFLVVGLLLTVLGSRKKTSQFA